MIESYEQLSPAKKSEIKQLTKQIEGKLTDIQAHGTLISNQTDYLFTSNIHTDKHVILKALQHLIKEWQNPHISDEDTFEINLKKVHQALVDHPRYNNSWTFSFFDITTKDLVHNALRLLPGLPQKQAAPLDAAGFYIVDNSSEEDQYCIDGQGPIKIPS